jgi:8-oxo-dGTP diphosphatase
MGIDRGDYPHLFQERVWSFGPTRAVFELGAEPPTELIGQVSMLPYIGDEWLLLRYRDGYWFPGGHLEPGESYTQTIRREMHEEAGARVLSYVPLGAWRCRSLASVPHRPHVPYPLSYWAVGYGEVELVEKPEDRVLEVETLPLEEACRRLRQTQEIGPELAELYRLAAALRAIAR